ncbi:MAG: GYD domain-containing protein [Candidatus Hadarchaeales archaeon]
MPTYVLLSILTAEGRKTLKEKPTRILEVNKEIEAFGAKVLKQYAVLGPYDFVNIVEAPNNETIARISIELGSRGTLKVMSLPAVAVEEFIEKIKP